MSPCTVSQTVSYKFCSFILDFLSWFLPLILPRCHISFPASGLWDLQRLLPDGGGSWWRHAPPQRHHHGEYKHNGCERQCPRVQLSALHCGGVRRCCHGRLSHPGMFRIRVQPAFLFVSQEFQYSGKVFHCDFVVILACFSAERL